MERNRAAHKPSGFLAKLVGSLPALPTPNSVCGHANLTLLFLLQAPSAAESSCTQVRIFMLVPQVLMKAASTSNLMKASDYCAALPASPSAVSVTRQV